MKKAVLAQTVNWIGTHLASILIVVHLFRTCWKIAFIDIENLINLYVNVAHITSNYSYLALSNFLIKTLRNC